jgi:hypothetical protein
MRKGKPVLFTTSVIFNDAGKTPQTSVRRQVSDRLREAVEQAFAGVLQVTVVGSVSEIPLDDPDANAGECSRCCRWTSDFTRSETRDGLPWGRKIEGKLVCDECECRWDEPGYPEAVAKKRKK